MKILVTAALPYVNNVPHLGNLVPTLSADVYQRFLKLKQQEVIFVCGTDEHGTTTETKALEEKTTPEKITEKYHNIHKQIYKWFNFDFDFFGRTSCPANTEQTIEIFNKLKKNNYILEQTLKQFYCEHDKKFLADRFIGGICPKCGYAEARGDQCENCGQLLDPEELQMPKCKICGNIPILKETEHFFIDLPKLEPELKSWIKKSEHSWSDNAKTMTEGWLKEGLKPRCITRDLNWGIPVPDKPGKVFYSWFDAPIGYIGIVRQESLDWPEWWKNPRNVELVQFMGKDNIPFHTILFPAFCIGAKDNYTLLNRLSVNEYLNYEGGQFSKSKNIGVFGDSAMESNIPSDVWRYYIMINRPERQDTEFVWADFQSKLNAELIGNLTNFFYRTLTFLNKLGEIPKYETEQEVEDFFKQTNTHKEQITKLLENIELKSALKNIMSLSKLGNKFFQEREPWANDNKNNTLYACANLVKDLSILISPYCPDLANNVQNQLNLTNLTWEDLNKPINSGIIIDKPKLLLKKLEDKDIQNLADKFGKKKNFFPLDLKVAKIIEVEDHPNADKLYKIQLDLGTEKRQVVAGIKQWYSKEDLKDKQVICVTNLEPAKLRGIKSEGMMLAAEKNDDVELLTSTQKVGTQITPEGYEVNDKIINFKQFSALKISVMNNEVLYKNSKLNIKTKLKEGVVR